MKNKFRQFSPVKDFLIESVKVNKIKTIVLLSCCLLLFITGIIVAVQTGTNNPDNIFGFALREGSFKIITSSFFTRLLSSLLIMLLLLLFSLNQFLFPLGLIILCYRSYLLSLNICFMIIIYSFSGALLSIFIILPCHLLCLLSLCLFYIVAIRTRRDWCCYRGFRFPKQRLFTCLGFFICLLVISLLESILLAICSANVILVI